MDGTDLGRLSEMLERRGSDPLIDDSIDADDLLDVAQKGEVSDTQLVVTDGEGELRWLEFNGGESVGFDKILSKHEAEIYEQYASVDSRAEIKQLIGTAIEESNTDSVIVKPNPGGGQRYFLDVEDGSYPFRVSTSENGFILSAHPDRNAGGMFN